MKERTCCFTGHRSIPDRDRVRLQKALESTVTSLVNSGYRYFGVGGALGFDTMAEQTILKLRQHDPSIKLILVLPCVAHPPQTRSAIKASSDRPTRWSTPSRHTQEAACSNATAILSIAAACVSAI